MRRPDRLLVALPALALPALALAALALTACSSDGEPTPTVAESAVASTSSTTPTASSTPTSSTSDVKSLAITMKGSKVTPAPGTFEVDKGDKVEITITRDTDGEVHVHQYDVEKQAKAGIPAVLKFTADQQGIFEVEAHDPDVLLTKLQVN